MTDARFVLASHYVNVRVSCLECDSYSEEEVLIGKEQADAIIAALAAAGLVIVKECQVIPGDADGGYLTFLESEVKRLSAMVEAATDE